MMFFRKALYLFLAFVFFIVGILGIILPVLPGFMFLVLSLVLLSAVFQSVSNWLERFKTRHLLFASVAKKAENWAREKLNFKRS